MSRFLRGIVIAAATGASSVLAAGAVPASAALSTGGHVGSVGSLAARTKVVQVATGDYHACALTSAGTVYCWGSNSSGQLGNNSDQNSSVPVRVSKLTDVVAIAAGYDYSCAVKANGQLFCWGSNAKGQLGNGSTKLSYVPKAVTALSDVRAVSAGNQTTCAITGSGAAFCWGDNSHAQIGNGTRNNAHTPVAVSGLGSVRSLSVGGSHACAVTTSNRPYCWGENFSGKLGTGSTDWSDHPRPVAVAGLDQVTTIKAGSDSTCAITTSNRPYCWGYNYFGQLGIGYADSAPHRFPIAVWGLDQAESISVGGSHACAITTSHQPYCWGKNDSGQLGDGTTRSWATTAPVPVTGLDRVKAVSAQLGYSCAITDRDQLYCWGKNDSGQLGNGTTESSSTPVAVTGLS